MAFLALAFFLAGALAVGDAVVAAAAGVAATAGAAVLAAAGAEAAFMAPPCAAANALAANKPAIRVARILLIFSSLSKRMGRLRMGGGSFTTVFLAHPMTVRSTP